MTNSSFVWSYSDHETTILVSGWSMKSCYHTLFWTSEKVLWFFDVVSKLWGQSSHLLIIFLKPKSNTIEVIALTGDERYVCAHQTRRRWGRSIPEGAHPCFRMMAVPRRHPKAGCHGWTCICVDCAMLRCAPPVTRILWLCCAAHIPCCKIASLGWL